MVSGVGHNHTEKPVDRLEWRQAEIRIEANDFGDDVAHLGQHFAANILDFVRAQPPDLLDHCQRQSKIG
jgi:hypothetical protein